MLPSELLAVVRWKGQIRPKYAKLDGRSIAAAEAVASVYAHGLGMRRGELREKVSELEDACGDYRLIRGLAALVERRCIFEAEAPSDPIQLRHKLFTLATQGFDRRSAVEAAAEEFGLTPEQVEASMYADLEEEAVMKEAPKLEPLSLLKQYNLSLTQTLLFHSTEAEFLASGNWQRIFRAIKRHGLMYTARRLGQEFAVKVDGPASILKLTKRYGTSMAKVLPEVMRARPWRIEARILWRNMLLAFRLDSERHSWLFEEHAVSEEFDSAVEAEFASKFRALGTGWEIQREAVPIEAGSSVLIPDFTLRFGGETVHMEIVGFWTKDYLKRKIEKLSEVRDAHFILAVDEELSCERLARLASDKIHIIYYKERIPVKEVLNVLRPIAEGEAARLGSSIELKLDRDMVPLEEAARRAGAPAEAAARAYVESHELIGDHFISKRILSEASTLLKKVVEGETPLPKVLEAIKEYGFPDPVAVITRCGYRVKWRGLMVKNAVVQRPPDRV